MYLEHFGLNEIPFRITPHTEFFFSGAKRGDTLDALIYAIVQDEGIVKVTGEVGSGKTMLCRVLMERLPSQVVIVYLANPSLSRDDIVFTIAADLGLPVSEHSRVSLVVRMLQTKLIELHGEGRQVVVLIDEAHAMPLETLEEIRLLSNLETNQHKLLQLVMFGQPELDEILARADMRQLKERITQNFQLEPLRRDDIAAYLDFRMRTAGYRGPEVFSPAAVKLITTASLGLTRRVNILAEKSLLSAYAAGTHEVTPNEVEAAIRDSQYDNPSRLKKRYLVAVIGLVVAVTVAALLVSLVPGSNPQLKAPTPAVGVPKAPMASPNREPAPGDGNSDSPGVVPPRLTFTESENAAISQLSPATQERVRSTRAWIDGTDGNRWFVQLISTNASQLEYAQNFLDRADRLLGPDQLRLYVADRDKDMRVGVIFGDFPNWQAANRAAQQLPEELRISNPFPRQVLWIK